MRSFICGIGMVMVILLGGSAVASEFSAVARVDRNQITPEESVILQVEVTGGKAEVDVSAITDFTVLSKGTSSQRTFINGKSEHKVVYQYRLAPNGKGELRIPSLRVGRKKEHFFTQEIIIRVADTLSSGPKAVFIKAKISQDHPVTGQHLLYVFQLYSARSIARASLGAPKFKGFTARELEQRDSRNEVVNGIAYAVTEIRYLLTPKAPGTFTIEPATLAVEVVESRNKDPFDSFFSDSFFSGGRTRSLRLRSNPVTVTVAPLPAVPSGLRFSGLVGDFALEANLVPHALAVGESATLTLTLEGRGNLMDAGAPTLELNPGDFKVYEDEPIEEIRVTPMGFEGKRVFKRALVPLRPGNLVIPPQKLCYFDTREQVYKKLDTPALGLTVSGTQAVSPVEGRPAPNRVEKLNDDILDIHPGLDALESKGAMGVYPFLGGVLAPGLVFLVSSILASRRGRRRASVSHQMEARSRKNLARAGKALSPGNLPGAEFHGFLHRALVSALLARVDQKGENLTRDEARKIMEDTRVGAPLDGEIMDLMENMDAARFGGAKMDHAQGKKALDLVKKVLKTSVVLLICALGMTPYGAEAAMPVEGPRNFLTAVESYRSGDFERAGQLFQELARGGIESPKLYFNLGNTYFKAGDMGRAILWYERARELSPRDPDLLFNLDHARSRIKDQEEPRFSLWRTLTFGNHIPLKWMQWACILSSLLFFSHALVRRIRQRRILTNAGKFMLVLLGLFLVFSALGLYNKCMPSRAIILGPVVAVRSGTDPASTRLFDLHAGTRVEIKGRARGYLKILFTPDKVGWVKLGEAEPI